MRDIYIAHTGNGSELQYNSSITVETTFSWFYSYYQRIRFLDKLAAKFFIELCDSHIKSHKHIQHGKQNIWKCSLTSLCPFHIRVAKEFDTSRYFCVKEFIPHDHSVDLIPEGRISKEKSKVLMCMKDRDETTLLLQGYQQQLVTVSNTNSIKKLKTF